MRLPGVLHPLRGNTVFRRLFVGLTVSRTGDAFTLVALSWLMLSIAGPGELGVMLFLSAVPAIVAAPLAGHVIDTVGLRIPVVVDNAIRAALTAGLAILAATDDAAVGHLFAFAVLSSMVGAVSDVGLEVAVPAVVDDDHLEEANTLVSVIWDVAALVGPLAAGLLIAGHGTAWALAVDAVSFVVVGCLCLSLPARAAEGRTQDEAPAAAGPGRRSAQLLRGFVLLWRNKPVLTISVVMVGFLAVSGAQEVLYPVFVADTLSLDADAYGLLVSVAGGLSLVGTVCLTPVFRRWRPVWALSTALLLRGVLLLPMAGARGLPSATFWAASSTALDGPFYPIARALTQRLVPGEHRGVVTGARTSLGLAGYPLGNALGGLALAGFAGPGLIVVLGLAHIPLVLLLVCSRSVRALQSRGERREATASSPDAG